MQQAFPIHGKSIRELDLNGNNTCCGQSDADSYSFLTQSSEQPSAWPQLEAAGFGRQEVSLTLMEAASYV